MFVRCFYPNFINLNCLKIKCTSWCKLVSIDANRLSCAITKCIDLSLIQNHRQLKKTNKIFNLLICNLLICNLLICNLLIEPSSANLTFYLEYILNIKMYTSSRGWITIIIHLLSSSDFIVSCGTFEVRTERVLYGNNISEMYWNANFNFVHKKLLSHRTARLMVSI